MSARDRQASWRLFVAAIGSMTLWLGCPPLTASCELSPSPQTALPERGISAHRGGKLGCPVNTLGAFQRAIRQGVHQIELDVRATADDVIVVAHDDQVTDKDHTVRISESTFDQVRKLELVPCQGEKQAQHIPTLEHALAIMPQNIWINVDMKNNEPRVAQLVAETVATAHRFNQVIFATRHKAVPPVRQVAKKAASKSWIANMNRELFRQQYVNATINSGAEFIQLVHLPYLPFVRSKPSQDTMERLKIAGVQVNYSWLREEDEGELKQELQDLFDRGVNFVLIDHVEPAMKAAATLGIPPLVPRWDNSSSPHSEEHPRCPPPS